MKHLQFENNDLFPPIGIGTYLSKPEDVYDAVIQAIKIGYRHIDCASIYGNEVSIGKAIHEAIHSGLVRRQDLVVCSKLWNNDHAPEAVNLAIRKSLKALQLDYLDVYLIHWPVAFKSNAVFANSATDLLPLEEMPLTTTWEAMIELKKQGLVQHIGVSNFNRKKITELIEETSCKPEVNQIEVHPFFQQKELVAWCQNHNILVTAFSPLGSRHLANNEAGILSHPTIQSIATKNGCTPAQVILQWGMHIGLSVIPKTTKQERLKENFEAQHVSLNEEDMKKIAALDKGTRMAKGNFCIFPEGSYTSSSIWDE